LKVGLGAILHTRKDLAVSPPLKELVSVRTSTLAGGGGYPLRLISTEAETMCSDFPPPDPKVGE